MVLKSNLQIKNGNEIFLAEFTNGTVNQLKELADFLDKKDFELPKNKNERLKSVLEVAIGLIERVKKENS